MSATDEAAAWGAALCAGAAVGLYDDVQSDPRDMQALDTRFEPDPVQQTIRDGRYRIHQQIAQGLMPHWESLASLETLQ